MDNEQIISNNNRYFKIISYIVSIMIITALAGCSGTYGGLKRDKQIFEAFENNQLSEDYKYFYNAVNNQTYAVLGIDPKYRLESKLWREVDPNTEEFRKLTNRLWEDFDYTPYGATLHDPTGNKVGVWYSSVYFASLKFYGDEIEVLMDTPYLWGPEGGSGIRLRAP
jgi:hypothetical protein